MAIPESQLETWSNRGAVTTSASTYETIRGCLENDDGEGYAGKSYQIFLQGSYGNHTNIYRESDVDVVIRLDSVYYRDVSELSIQETALYNSVRSGATYTYDQYKADVTNSLVRSFGSDVEAGTKAVHIKPSGNRRSSDVICACQFRRYLRFQTGADTEYITGICFFKSDGSRVVNYPRQHAANCTAKNQATESMFKPVVRIFKNMRTRLVDDDLISDGLAASYFIEGLLYNVPDEHFIKTTYGDAFVACLNWLNATSAQTRNEFVCANRQYYLLRGPSDVMWSVQSCTAFLAALVNLWNGWGR
jgi:hypothetical protein